jgi:GNAT superfamily N-acetyltransferase
MTDPIPPALPTLSYRPARPRDWLTVSPWLERTWGDWGDYIDGGIWQDWLADDTGQFTMAEQDGQPVAFYRLARLDEAEWWLEGVRVDPARQRQGIGRALMAYVVETFRAEARGILRFTTSSDNPGMVALGNGAGFRHRMSYTEVTAPAQPADFRNLKRLQPPNFNLAWNYLRVSPMYRVNPFAEDGFVCYYLTRDRLEKSLIDPSMQVIGWRQLETLRGLAILYSGEESPREHEGNPLRLGFLAAPDDTTVTAMLNALCGLAAQRGHDRLLWKMPLGVGLERPIAGTDLVRTWGEGEELWLFELPLR